MLRPSLEEFKHKAKQGNLIPVYREILADMETPVSAFLKIDDGRHSFLLESVEGGEKVGPLLLPRQQAVGGGQKFRPHRRDHQARED